MTTLRMRVHKYIPDKLYGFAIDPVSGQQVFFHLGSFVPGDSPHGRRCSACPPEGCSWATTPTPPVLGEPVEVTFNMDKVHEGQQPRAEKVVRQTPPLAMSGTVEVYETHRGFGFIKGDDGNSYHLHRSEVMEDRLPVVGQRVMFYSGVRQSRPRACHVRICG